MAARKRRNRQRRRRRGRFGFLYKLLSFLVIFAAILAFAIAGAVLTLLIPRPTSSPLLRWNWGTTFSW